MGICRRHIRINTPSTPGFSLGSMTESQPSRSSQATCKKRKQTAEQGKKSKQKQKRKEIFDFFPKTCKSKGYKALIQKQRQGLTLTIHRKSKSLQVGIQTHNTHTHTDPHSYTKTERAEEGFIHTTE
ncbi:hypothetical protein J1N35_007479 [Gossypium stocksii]|uniref:Uncharacterized protein n=1 Tax=Gossypium stocksii TaxID=47602 RepID=A0A9D3W7D1_9ROSI|nr:hypothetical protein J1N35_007479 [Gossypium stocksii]